MRQRCSLLKISFPLNMTFSFHVIFHISFWKDSSGYMKHFFSDLQNTSCTKSHRYIWWLNDAEVFKNIVFVTPSNGSFIKLWSHVLCYWSWRDMSFLPVTFRPCFNDDFVKWAFYRTSQGNLSNFSILPDTLRKIASLTIAVEYWIRKPPVHWNVNRSVHQTWFSSKN